MEIVFECVENIVGNGDNAFSPFSATISKALFVKVLKIGKGMVKGKINLTHSHTMTPSDAPGKQAF